jgi:hypothetical protein
MGGGGHAREKYHQNVKSLIIFALDCRFGNSADLIKVPIWSDQNKLHLHPAKCKELRIQFAERECMVEPIIINGQHLEIVKSAKILGMTLTDDLKWNKHIGIVVLKASKRLYLLKQLRRAGVDKKHLIGFYNACIKSILEYACEVFHSSLPTYLSDDLERVQRRAMRIIFPGTR